MKIGIDPGASGAIVVLGAGNEFIAALNMPTITVGSKKRCNGAAIVAFLDAHVPNRSAAHAYLEQVNAMPGQGVSSMFSFGHSAGVVEGLMQGLGIAYTLVTPQKWKKLAGLIGQDKDASRTRAIQLYPGLRELDTKARGQAVADALLIAKHGSE